MTGKNVNTKTADEKQEANAELKPFVMNACQPREQSNLTWRLLARGVPLDDLTNTERYPIIGAKLRAFDEILAIGDDYVAQLIVIDSEPGFGSVVSLLHSVPFPKILKPLKGELPPGTYIEFDPLTHTFTGRRESDGAALTGAVRTRNEARSLLANHAIFRG